MKVQSKRQGAWGHSQLFDHADWRYVAKNEKKKGTN